jgi:hypothetical protein
MPMFLVLLIAAAAPTLVTLPPGAHPLAPLCHRPSTMWAAGPKDARIHPLGQEPPAQQIIAVLNLSPEGCVTPIVVRAEVGQRR